ncbi:MAG: riboflavin biosynthesis protein RibF, partial [Bacteroidia bacterium]|nr:riboflavin biosynthesis protein RibF [Bacteroidia bacterium]
EINEVAVSSTKIRKALESGDLKTSNAYLGYPYMLTGTVVSGKGLGRELDFPTANLQIAESFKLIPKNGVYAVKSEIDGDNIYGMMNIGVNPTVNENSDQNIEIHFFDFDKDIYGQELQIDVLVRLRDERKFDSLDALKSQLDIDQQNAKEQIKSL